MVMAHFEMLKLLRSLDIVCVINKWINLYTLGMHQTKENRGSTKGQTQKRHCCKASHVNVVMP